MPETLPGFESVERQNFLATEATCSPRGCPSAERISHNRQWMAHAYSLPCTPDRDNECTFPRGRRSSRLEGLERELSGFRSIAASFARFQRTSASADSRWEEGTGRKGRRRHKE
jgi:hypothetical protein